MAFLCWVVLCCSTAARIKGCSWVGTVVFAVFAGRFGVAVFNFNHLYWLLHKITNTQTHASKAQTCCIASHLLGSVTYITRHCSNTTHNSTLQTSSFATAALNMHTFTKQQRQGGPKYQSRTLVGNWSEELENYASNMRTFLASRAAGTTKTDL